ncbi:zinc-binding dehydrogenase [Actinosynnema sp. NPDC023587]|uniref:alcohol dehydrogenase catalytic domain-containing protein n=1 Tax=Actinosynnema sp. NPDC023587 TaxID=3154695 RepID=UPI0033D46317
MDRRPTPTIPRRSLYLDEVPTPELGPGEALVAVMASAIDYNTVRTSIFEPVSTFGFLKRLGRSSPESAKHDLPHHVVGSDLAGVVLRTGPGVNAWRPGDRVVAHCLDVRLEHPDGHGDTVLDPERRIWGFETDFGGLAEVALVRANQLMPMPEHLTWEEAASPGLVNSTAYRRLVSTNGANGKQGDTVLIWKDEHEQDPQEWKRLGAKIREPTGGGPDIVFEHPGRETFGASVFVAGRGGTIVTCASTSGFPHQYDNRYLWVNLKRIIGSHLANYREAREANRLVAKGKIHPTLSKVYSLEDTGQAAHDVHRNAHQGKVGVLCLAPEEGPGVFDHELRSAHLTEINRFRGV